MKSILIKLKGHPHVQKGTAYTILFAMGFCHLLNDMIQSVIPAMYPVLKDNFGFTFAQIGIITLVFQLTSSVFQPFVGQYADRRPQPYSLSAGMCFTLTGLLLLAFASNFFLILLAVAIIGCGSSVFHPEASRVAQIASGGQEKSGPVYFSSRRKRRKRHRTITRRIDYYSLRATCRRVVFNRSITRLCHTGTGRILVQADAFPNRNVASSSTNDKL